MHWGKVPREGQESSPATIWNLLPLFSIRETPQTLSFGGLMEVLLCERC